ncbi:MAG: hypothetical protein LBJ41_01760 [Treponema sp.]|jgi:hypothetical protein|nr:hypothetical protein [Treponema sp.]
MVIVKTGLYSGVIGRVLKCAVDINGVNFYLIKSQVGEVWLIEDFRETNDEACVAYLVGNNNFDTDLIAEKFLKRL